VRGTAALERRPDSTLSTRRSNSAVALFVLLQLVHACAIPGTKAEVVTSIRIVPPSPVVGGDTVIELGVHDAAGKAFSDAALELEAHMTHPGMAPVIEPAVADGQGRYKITLRFTMAGTWILFVKGTLADRRLVDHRLGEVTVLPAR
jgi:hypothetical protein